MTKNQIECDKLVKALKQISAGELEHFGPATDGSNRRVSYGIRELSKEDMRRIAQRALEETFEN